jgi:hypothetical protein
MVPRIVAASLDLVGSVSLSKPADCHVLAKPSSTCTKPEVVDTWVAGFWFKIAASTVEPDRGMPDKKCSVFFIVEILKFKRILYPISKELSR